MSVYKRRSALLTQDEKETAVLLDEVKEFNSEQKNVIENKIIELGEDNFKNLFRRLSLQMIDTLGWNILK